MTYNRYFDLLPSLLIVSAFGIYIGFGLRVEHLILYPSVLLFLLISILTDKKIIKNYFSIFGMWVVIVITGIIVTLLSYSGTSISSIFADIESFLQPLALIALFMFSVAKPEPVSKIQRVSNVLIFMLSLNTIFIFISMFSDISNIGSYFWGGEESVAQNAMGNGRYSGIFNQPMEAGVMYSVGLLAWLYLSEKIEISKLKYIFGLYLMIFGGLITVSKVFLFGGLGLFFIGVFFNKKMRKLIFLLTFWSVLLGYTAYYSLFKTWTGLEYLFRFFGSNENFLYLITAGRFGGDNSQQSSYFKKVWDQSPFYGKGFGVTETYDSGFFQVFAIGGSVNLVIYLVILISLLLMGFMFLKQNNFKSESKLFISLVILIIASNFGSPTLTLNRVSIVIWVFLGVLIQYFHLERTSIKEKLKGLR